MLPAIVCDRPFTKVAVDRLVQCVALGIEDPVEVSRSLGLTVAALTTLISDNEFADQVLRVRASWLDPGNATERIRAKADVALEENLKHLYTLAANPDIPPRDRIDALKALKTFASMQKEQDEARGAQGVGGGGVAQSFNLNIYDVDQGGRTFSFAIGRGPESDSVGNGAGEAPALEQAA